MDVSTYISLAKTFITRYSACKKGKKMSLSGSHVPIWKFYYYRRRGKHICKDILYFLPAVLIFAFPKYVFYPSGASFVCTLGKKPNLTLLSCLSAKSLHHVWLCNPMDCSPPGSSVHGILQSRILEWLAMPSSRGSSQSMVRTHVSCLLHWQKGSLPRVPPGRPLLSWQRIITVALFFLFSYWSIMPVLTSFHLCMGLSQRSLFWIFLVYLLFCKPALCRILFRRLSFFLKNIFFSLVASGLSCSMWGLLLPCGIFRRSTRPL